MLVQRLLAFLNYNSQQYINARAGQDFETALVRLENMRKFVSLIKQVCAEGRDRLSADEAFHVFRIQRHLHALHILPHDQMPNEPYSLAAP